MFPTLKTMLNAHTAESTTSGAVMAIVPQIRQAIDLVWEDLRALNSLKAAKKEMTVRVITRALDHDFWNAVVMLDEALRLSCGRFVVRYTEPGWAYIHVRGQRRLWIDASELETLADAATALEVPIADLPTAVVKAIFDAKKGMVMTATKMA